MDRGQQFPYDITHTLVKGGYDVTATHRKTGKKVGKLSALDDGLVALLGVDKEHRRRGVATQMWNYATEHPDLPDPQHSTTRTEDGEAWAQALEKNSGKEVPEWKYLGVDLFGDYNG